MSHCTFYLILTLLTGMASSSAEVRHPKRQSKISAQIFCDNFCKIYYNGELVWSESASRVVDKFEFSAVKTGTRTFAVWLADNPYDENVGIWNYESPDFLTDQIDPITNQPIVRQWCLGDGGFRAVFRDEYCDQEIIVTGNDWKCNTIVSGPRDIEACFPKWNYNPTAGGHTPETIGGEGDKYILYDPCIRSSNDLLAPDTANCDCIQDFSEDYVNWATDWYKTGFNDSLWLTATTYTEDEAVPKRGRRAAQLLTECDDNQYCNTPTESWDESQFIWSDKLELDNVVVCRFEYESKCERSDQWQYVYGKRN